MATTRTSRKGGTRRPKVRLVVHKARGAFHPRVQKVGPEHFGLVSVDCAKARSKFMVADFYGKVLIPPTVLEHNLFALEAAVAQVRDAFAKHAIHDSLVAIERTGRYHQIVQRSFATAKFETRLLHPFATKQYRQPADPGNKTDDTDLLAIHRAAVNGFALCEPEWDVSWRTLQLLVRHRRSRLSLRCQGQGVSAVSPPFIVPNARQVVEEMLLGINTTWPSANDAFTPPGCLLRADL